jgi:hypothetical protein
MQNVQDDPLFASQAVANVRYSIVGVGLFHGAAGRFAEMNILAWLFTKEETYA